MVCFSFQGQSGRDSHRVAERPPTQKGWSRGTQRRTLTGKRSTPASAPRADGENARDGWETQWEPDGNIAQRGAAATKHRRHENPCARERFCTR